MNRPLFNRLVILCYVLMLVLATPILTSPSNAQDTSTEQVQINEENGKKLRISTQPVLVMSDGSVVPGTGSMLVRTRDNVFATMHTSGLPPGMVVTAWFGIFNRPKHCATRPCTAADFSNPAVQGSRVNFGGQIIGAHGAATFGAFRTVGDTTGVFDGPGLLDPLRAEIHLVTRSHGPAILDDAEMLRQQLTTFNGGCPPNTCGNLQASIHQP